MDTPWDELVEDYRRSVAAAREHWDELTEREREFVVECEDILRKYDEEVY